MQKRAFYTENDIIFENFEESKDIIRFDQGVAFLPKENEPFLHYHSKIEIGICLEGTGIFYGKGFAESINQGDIVFFLPGKTHYSQSVSEMGCGCRFAYLEPRELLFLVFQENKRATDLLSEAFGYDVPAIIRKNEYPHIYNILKATLEDVFAGGENTNLLCALHISELLLKIPECFDKIKAQTADAPQKPQDKIALVEAFISSRYNEDITSDMLCNICYLSESQLRRRFKATYGLSPLKYLHNLRCSIAGSLLIRTDLTVADISQRVGYCDVSEFYRHFVARFKVAPTLYRKKYD